jgi:hypothetical protein
MNMEDPESEDKWKACREKARKGHARKLRCSLEGDVQSRHAMADRTENFVWNRLLP